MAFVLAGLGIAAACFVLGLLSRPICAWMIFLGTMLTAKEPRRFARGHFARRGFKNDAEFFLELEAWFRVGYWCIGGIALLMAVGVGVSLLIG